MNNHGWGLRAMLALVCILGVALYISATIATKKLKLNIIDEEIIDTSSNTNGLEENVTSKEEKIDYLKEYHIIEEKMAQATNKYVDDIYKDKSLANYVKLKLSILEANNYIEEVYDLKDDSIKCVGYVSISYENDKFNYIPFLRCGTNYETEGFIDRYID